MKAEYASRKFLLTLLILGVETALLVLGYIPATIWKEIVEILIFTYIAGNVAYKAVEKVGPKE